MEFRFTRRFSMAHRLRFSESNKCRVPHGHNELITARLVYSTTARLNGRTNVAADFAELKEEWHHWIDRKVDHAFQLGAGDPLVAFFRENEPERMTQLMITPGDPSTEVLAALCLCKYTSFLSAIDAPFKVASIEICETPTNSVVISREDLSLFPALMADGWWSRADQSINDLDNHSDQATSSSANALLTST